MNLSHQKKATPNKAAEHCALIEEYASLTLVIGQVAQVIMTANTNLTLKMIRIQTGNVPIKLKTRPVQRRKGKNLRLLMLEGYARQIDS